MDDRSSAAQQPRLGAELTLRGLRVFVAVEETGSVGGAAERIGGSPSGVSQQITALEKAVRARLFDRRARPVRLTPAGQVLRVHARRILEAVSDAQAELAEQNLAHFPQLTLAIIDDLDVSLTPTLVSILQKRFKNCFFNTFSGRSDAVTEKLENREADIAVSGLTPKDPNGYRSLPILRERFVLVAAKGVMNPQREMREQLARTAFVQYSEAMPIGRLVAQHLQRVGFTVKRRYAFEASRSIFAMLVKAKGWTLTTPLNLLDAEQFLPLVDVFPLPFAALTRRIHLVARTEELGDLPVQLAADCRRLIARDSIPRFETLAPALSGWIEILEE
jgi:DNA-binding transcriptional LysR family regulator